MLVVFEQAMAVPQEGRPRPRLQRLGDAEARARFVLIDTADARETTPIKAGPDGVSR